MRRFHPASRIVPMRPSKEFSDLVSNIRENGLREAIVCHRDGRILDGRSRYRACVECGVVPRFVTYEGADSSLLEYVIARNLLTRNWSDSQRAIVAASLATLTHGGNRHSRPLNGFSQAEAARLLRVSDRSVRFAKLVREYGVTKLIASVRRDEISVSKAAKIAILSPREQQAYIDRYVRSRAIRRHAS